MADRAALGDGRIERIAGGRRQHDVGRLLLLGPVLAASMHCSRLDVVMIVAAEGMNGAGELREALHVAALFEDRRIAMPGGKRMASAPSAPPNLSIRRSKAAITSSNWPRRP